MRISGWQRRARAFVVAAAIATASSRAGAQPAEQADSLFEEGRVLYDAGKLDEAYAKLARSQELDPSVGTAGLLAACEEKRGFLARAYKRFVEAAKLARAAKDKREAYATERAAALLPKVPRLVIRVDATAPPDHVTRAGQEVSRADLGTEILVDPGRFEVIATGPGRGEERRTVVAEPGGRVEIVLPPFAIAGPAAAAPPPAEPSILRPIGFAVGAVGLVGLGVGAGFGARAIAKNSASKDPMLCAPSAPTCTARSDAFKAATISTATFVTGAAALTAGVILIVVGRPKSATTASATVSLGVAPGGGTLNISGSF